MRSSLGFLKTTNWYLGALSSTAPDATKTQEKADQLLKAMLETTDTVPAGPQELKQRVAALPKNFGVAFLTEMLAYTHPADCWEYNGPIEQAAERLGFESWDTLPHGEKNEFGRYFALRPLMEGLRDALGFAGLPDPSFLDVDKLLWMVATHPEALPTLDSWINESALDAMLEDLRVWHPRFTTFDDRGSSWWQDERVYKTELIELFIELFGKPGDLQSGRIATEALLNLLTKRLKTTKQPQNLLSWHGIALIRDLMKDDKTAEVLGRAIIALLDRTTPSEQRLEHFNQAFWPMIQALAVDYGASWTRSIPTLLLMLQDPKNEILIRTDEFRSAARALRGDPILPEGVLGAQTYRKARGFARALFNSFDRRGLQPLDLLDVQGFLHVVSGRSTWIAQANPAFFDVVSFLEAGHTRTMWSLPQNANKVREGDEVYLWVAGQDRGIVAWGSLSTAAIKKKDAPQDLVEAEQPYYRDRSIGPTTDQVTVIELKKVFPKKRLLAEVLKKHPQLKDLTILRQAAGTIFSVKSNHVIPLRRLVMNIEVDPPDVPSFDALCEQIREAGLFFPRELVANYLLALQTKRFVILTGISGTGKTKLAMEVAERFPASWSTKAAIEVPEGALVLAVQPYTLKYGNLVVPVELSRGIDWDAMTSADGRHRIPVEFDGGTLDLNFWRDATRDVTVLTLRGEFKVWFRDTFAEGDDFMLQGLEDNDGRVTRLSISKPAQVTTTRAIENCEVVAVRPDWTDHRGLLGYFNPLTGRYVRTPFLELIMRAADEVTRAGEEGRQAAPFFAVLDEMNLARVEHYFSDVLSCMESDEPIHLHDDDKVGAGETEDARAVPKELQVPSNLFVVGTVNVDETTYMFSPKVLDRAFTIELNEVDLRGYSGESTIGAQTPLELSGFTGLEGEWPKPDATHWRAFGGVEGGKLRAWLLSLNEILEHEGRHFGYRVANEIARFVTLANEQTSGSTDALRAAFDIAVLEKVLPKLNGTQQELHEPIRGLFGFALDPDGKLNHDPDDLTPVDGGYSKRQTEGKKSATESETQGEHEDGLVTPALPRTARKLWRMARRLRQRGFVSYIE